MRIRWSELRERFWVGLALLGLVLMVASSSGCASPSSGSILERKMITAQGVVTSDVNASDMYNYILANETRNLRIANAETQGEYDLRLSVARSAEEGAALALQYAEGLGANEAAFVREVERQLVMVERQRLVGRALATVDAMADYEGTAAQRAFDEFKRGELPRIMQEARDGLAQIAEHNRREALAREQRRAEREAERRAAREREREREREERHQEPDVPVVPKPDPQPEA